MKARGMKAVKINTNFNNVVATMRKIALFTQPVDLEVKSKQYLNPFTKTKQSDSLYQNLANRSYLE